MSTWNNFKERSIFINDINFSLDYSRVDLPNDFFSTMQRQISKAFTAMDELEKGAIANPDEKRMVGHYWLRDVSLAPSDELKAVITETNAKIFSFAKRIHAGEIANAKKEKFKHLLVVGIGGSALGPQFVSQALRSPSDPLGLYFFDNTDPDGMDRVLASIPSLAHTVVVVISKSGGTKETRNGQCIAKAAFQREGLSVGHHFVAVTGEGSELDKTAMAEGWMERFPMWDWIGGRTSEFSAVGLLPAALQGFPIQDMLNGACAMDKVTRVPREKKNPAMMLALMWYAIGNGKGEKDMVILPYKDRIELLSRYLQQLVMESLGKEFDNSGKVVNQGIAVYGNKGSTDQHAYVQQLRDGVNNFFAVFIHVMKDSTDPRLACSFEVEPGITCGDYLNGFYLGTRTALYEKKRQSVSIAVGQADAFTIGMLIALFERAVGYYASLVNINAYHQPGVEAGKKAAADVLSIQQKVVSLLNQEKNPLTIEEIGQKLSLQNTEETIFHVLRHLAANKRVKVLSSASVFDDKYSLR